MGFHEVQFPDDISYGSIGGPGFNTNIIETSSGQEQRIARWSNPRNTYDVAYGVKTFDQLGTLRNFYIARQGPVFGFRYKDFLDFTTAANHRDAFAFDDYQIGVGDGIETNFQLIKEYSSGAVIRTRKILKPVSGQVKTGIDSVEQVSGWTVNTTTGIVTFTSAPLMGEVIQAGFEFDVPVRFGEGADQSLEMSIDTFSTGGAPNIPLIELFDELPISDEFFFGSSQLQTISANITLEETSGRMQRIDPQSNNLKVFLPDKATVMLGGPWFFIYNAHASNNLLIRTSNDVAIFTLPPVTGITLVLGLQTALTAVWYVF